MTLVAFPDSVALLIDYLQAELIAQGDSAAVQSDVPASRPTRFVTVRKTGGQRRNVRVDVPRLTVAGWAPSDPEASDLAELCRSLVFAMQWQIVGGVQVYDVTELADPSPLQDISDQPRWAFSVELALSGSVAA